LLQSPRNSFRYVLLNPSESFATPFLPGNDDGVCNALELAQAFGSLDLKGMNERLRCKVMQAIKTVAEETISGAIEGWRPHDQKDHALYCEALAELVKLIQEQDVAS